jgi:hypothetical protein
VSLERISQLGVLPTVYSLVYPETRRVFEAFRRREGLAEMYERAWTKHQDPMHVELFDTWRQWCTPVLSVDWDRFPHRYASAGSSEAIRDSIASYAAERCSMDPAGPPRLHVFAGEYEGYAAYARAYHCEVVTHDRADYAESMRNQCRPGERFYLSAPSSLDGDVWSELPAFWRFLAEDLPHLRVALDLCYVGCVGSGAYEIAVDGRCVDTLFFSLSKVFGVYYHRIGGVLTREVAPGMAGNIWFKNLFSLRFGTELLRRHDVFDLPRRARPHQEAVVDSLREIVGPSVRASDVVLLGWQPTPVATDIDPQGIDAAFGRGDGRRRYCLTPALDARLRASDGGHETT